GVRSHASSSCSTLRRCSSEKSNRATSRRASAGSSFSTAASRCSRSGVGCRNWRRSQRSRLTWAASIWAVTGSNRRPSACKADALPAELTARTWYTVHMAYPSQAKRKAVPERLRKLCLALPETSERLSHGAPSFFVREKKCFLMLFDDHHGDGIFGIWCAAPPGNQELLVHADPQRFFRPPYVGHRGWLGVRLNDGVDWDELAGIVEDAFATVAAKRLLTDAG